VENVELPVKSTAETGYEVNQSGSYSPYTHVTVFPCPHPVLAEGEAGQEGMPLNDMESSIIQHDSSNCKQFENVVGLGVGAPSSDDEVNGFSDEDLEPRADFDQEEILYINPVPTELPPDGIQPNDTPRRPARVAARPSRFRDDQFETEFRPGPSKYKPICRLDLGKGKPNYTTLGNSKQCCGSTEQGSTKNLLIQSPSGSLYLLRKRGHRLGWPTWPKV